MRIYEIITETVGHDQALWATATSILKPLARQAAKEKGPLWDRYEQGMTVGTLGELSTSTPSEIADVVLQFAPGETAEYFAVNSTSQRRDLINNYNAAQRYIIIGGGSYGLDSSDIKVMTSTLAHEMRHALDDTLSQGNFNKSHGRGPSAYRGQNQVKDLEHEQRPLEINAHYTQALEDIAKAVKSTTTTAQLHKIITQVFKTHWVGRSYRYNTQDPNYRRLIQRAVQYAQTVIDQKKQKLSANV